MSLPNSLYDSIMRDYSKRKAASAINARNLKNDIYSKNPRLSEIDELVASESIDASKRMMKGDLGAIDELKSKIAHLKSEKEKILAELGYSLEDLEPKYVCNDCKDTGFIEGMPCHCFRQASIDKVYSQSRFDDVLSRENFHYFRLDYYRKDVFENDISAYDNAENVLRKCKEFCNNPNGDNLLLYGPPGVGKTYLTHCIARELLDNAVSVLYFTAEEIVRVFEQETFDREKTFTESSENIFDADVLIIDDLGTEFPNSFTSAKIFTCINERLIRGRSTIISTNLSLQELLEIYSERTFSRISSFKIMKLFGDDIRIMNKAL